jgi:hypothetical protein
VVVDQQRSLEMACLTEEQLDELEERVGYALRSARDQGLIPDQGLHRIHVDVLVERAIRAQELRECVEDVQHSVRADQHRDDAGDQ